MGKEKNDKKWVTFHSKFSPVIVDRPTPAGKSANILADWNRQASTNPQFLTINGIPLQELAARAPYNNFNDIEELRAFFKDIILGGMTNLNDTKKEKIINYLLGTFHQGGWLYPVSAPFSVSMLAENKDSHEMEPFATVGEMDRKINIQLTSTGFKIQEITTVKNLSAMPGTQGEDLLAVKPGSPEADDVPDNKVYTINPFPAGPVPEDDYIVKIQGKIALDFSKNTKSATIKPNITIESNTISYGDQRIKALIDPRNFIQKIIDYFITHMGINKVKDLTSKFPERDEPPKEDELEQPSEEEHSGYRSGPE